MLQFFYLKYIKIENSYNKTSFENIKKILTLNF